MKYKSLFIIFLFSFLMASICVAQIIPYRFALNYDTLTIINDSKKANSFIKDYIDWEAQFYTIARDLSSGLTFDGFNLDTGYGLITEVRNWSAPSKESVDIALLVKVLTGHPLAKRLLKNTDNTTPEKIAIEIFFKKIRTYRDFNKNHPEFSGFLPWYIFTPDGISPADKWSDTIPGLDNGEWLWSLFTAEYIIRKKGYINLADEYKDYIEMLRKNLVKVFYDTQIKKIRADVRIIKNQSAEKYEYKTISRSDSNYQKFLTGEHGVHEGSMLVLMLTLFSKDIPPADVEIIWEDISMKRIEHRYGTTWEGFFGSAHEEWAYLFLPLLQIEEYQQLFRIREKIRTQLSVEKKYPGFPSSTNDPEHNTLYLSASGMDDMIASQPIENNDIFTIYGVFPLLLLKEYNQMNYGISWLINMLKANKMQTCYGSGESGSNDGINVSTVLTIDGKMLNVLALMGGIETETAQMLKSYGLFDAFLSRMKKEYYESFSDSPLHEPVGFALPQVSVPQIKHDYKFDEKKYTENKNFVKQIIDYEFQKKIKELLETYNWTNSKNKIEQGDIFWFLKNYNNIQQIEKFLINTTGKRLYIYIKKGEQNDINNKKDYNDDKTISLMNNWQLGKNGKTGWGSAGADRIDEGKLIIRGSGWTGEMLEPFASISRKYIIIKGQGNFRFEVKNQYDRKIIDTWIALKPEEPVSIKIPEKYLNHKISVIAICDYFDDVIINDILLSNKGP